MKTRMPIPTSGVREWCVLQGTAAGVMDFSSRMSGSIRLCAVECPDPARECSVAVLCKGGQPTLCGEGGSESAREGVPCVPGERSVAVLCKGANRSTGMPIPTSGVRKWCGLQRTAAGVMPCVPGKRSVVVLESAREGVPCVPGERSVAVLESARERVPCVPGQRSVAVLESAREGVPCVPGERSVAVLRKGANHLIGMPIRTSGVLCGDSGSVACGPGERSVAVLESAREGMPCVPEERSVAVLCLGAKHSMRMADSGPNLRGPNYDGPKIYDLAN